MESISDRRRDRSVRVPGRKLERALEELIELRLASPGQDEAIPHGALEVLWRTTLVGRLVVVTVVSGALPPLTKRQEQVLRLLGYGHGNAGIARILGITEDTVKFHLKSISKRWGVGSRAALARLAALLYG